MSQPRRCRVYGGIIRCRNPFTEEYEYVVMKARQTKIFSFPKGHSHPDEDPLVCALREIEEETGLDLKDVPTERCKRHLGSASFFLFELPDKYPLRPKDRREVEHVHWYTLEQMSRLHGNKALMTFVERELRYAFGKSVPNPTI